MSTIAKKLKAIADSKEAIRKKLFISPEIPLSAYAELVPGSPAVVKPDQSTFDSALPFGRMKLLEASKEALRVGLGLPVAAPFSAYAEKIAAPTYAGDFLTGNFRKNDVEVAFEEVAEFTRLSGATDLIEGSLVSFKPGESRASKKGLLLEQSATNFAKYSQSPVVINTPYEILEGGFMLGAYTYIAEGNSSLVQYLVPHYRPSPFDSGFSVIVNMGLARYVYFSSGHYNRFGFALDCFDKKIINFNLTGSSYIPLGSITLTLLPKGWARVEYTVTSQEGPGYYSRTFGLKSSDVFTTNGNHISSAAPLPTAFSHLQGTQGHTSSYIPNPGATPATRAPDILRVPLPAGHTLTLDADEGIKAERDGDFAVITADKPGYLRRFAVGPVRRSTMDFTKGEYKEGNVTVELSRLAEFTRLSEATIGVSGSPELVAPDFPRLVKSLGLLLEPSGTNIFIYNPTVGSIFTGSDSTSTWGPTEGMGGISQTAQRITRTGRVPAPSQFYAYRTNIPSIGKDLPITDSLYFRTQVLGTKICLTTGTAAENPKRIDYTPSSGVFYTPSQGVTGYSSESLGGWTRLTISSIDTKSTRSLVSAGVDEYFDVALPQREGSPFPTSFIPAVSSPATRAPDILRVPVSATQTLTYDADPSISMEMDGTTAVFTATEPGYIRSITLTEK